MASSQGVDHESHIWYIQKYAVNFRFFRNKSLTNNAKLLLSKIPGKLLDKNK